QMRVLIGILTLPDRFQERDLLRLVYGTQSPVGVRVDVRFVLCNVTDEDHKILVGLEIMRYADIIILNCRENMNGGKTYTFFSSLPRIFGSDPYDYVMKSDDDTYFRLQNLVDSLKPLPKEDLYYGFVIPCNSMNPFKYYMSGMGYLITWDIVEWISVSDIPKKYLTGSEDKVFGKWISKGHRGRNRYSAKWSMYDFPEPKTNCSHELWPETVGVHLLKNRDKWVRTLRYFNVTKDLKPSKLYHF
ncbi:hypothetical protein M569_01761, partial [Genlisea aurea]